MKSVKSVKFLAFSRRVLSAALASAVALAGTGVVGNAYAATASSTATSEVIKPIAIAAATGIVLNFGKFASRGDAASTVTITTGGTRGGSATLLTGATPTAAKFDVSGLAGATYVITQDATVNLTATGGANMLLTKASALAADSTVTGMVTGGTLDATSGLQSIYVGGSLAVGIAQAAGTYTGSIAVTVEYN